MMVTNMDDNRLRKLTPDKVVDIRNTYAEGKASHTDLARKYGISVATVSAIVRRRTWAWL